MYGEISEVIVFSPNHGRIVEGCCREHTVEHDAGRGSHPGKPFSRVRIAPASCGANGRNGVFYRVYCPPRASWVECLGFCWLRSCSGQGPYHVRGLNPCLPRVLQ